MTDADRPTPPPAAQDDNAALEAAFARHRDEHLDADTIEALLHALLERYPEAPVTASSLHGLLVEMPASVPLRSNPVLEGRSGLDAIPPEDRAAVFVAWERVLKEGAARTHLHPPGMPAVAFYLLDLQERHGVVFSLLWADEVEFAEEEVREALRPAPRFATVGKDDRAFLVKVDDAITEILGYGADELLGSRSLDFVHEDDHRAVIDHWLQTVSQGGSPRRVRQRWRRADGSWVWFEVTNVDLRDDPAHGCVIAEMVDISEEMAAHEALRAREQLLDRLASTVPVGLFQIDTTRQIVYTNERLHQILGLEREAAVAEQLATIVPGHRAAVDRAIDAVLDDGANADVEVELVLPGSGDTRFCTISLRALSHEDGEVSGAIACVTDVTDSAQMREELRRRATFDELTGCYSRAAILAELDANLDSGRRNARRAVMFVDLDRFKEINDRQGHAAGDEILRAVGEALRGALRDADLVGRLGGDEFLLLCPDIAGPEEAMRLAGRLVADVRNAVGRATGAVGVHLSMGVAWSEGDGVDADALVAAADRAMYESKRERLGEPKLAAAGLPASAEPAA